MKRPFFISVFAICVIAFISQSLLAQSPATVESAESQQRLEINDASSKPTTQIENDRTKTVSLQSTLNQEVINGTQEVTFNLGKQICGDTISVTWLIDNPLDKGIEFPRSTSSCGCVSELPKTIAIPSAAESLGENVDKVTTPTSVAFKITIPKEPEKLVKHIAFWDANGNARLHLTLEADVIPILRFDALNFAIVDEKQSTIRIPFTSEVEVLTPATFHCAAVGMEIKSSHVEWRGTGSGEVVLGIDTALTPQNVNESSVSISFEYLDKVAGQVPFKISYPSRVMVIPREPVFGKADGSYKSRFLVRSSKLTGSLQQSNRLKAYMIDDKGKHLSVPVKVESSVSNTASSIVNISVEVKSGSMEIAQRSQTVRFECGDWVQNISFRFDH